MGAAAVLLGSEDWAKQNGLNPLAYYVGRRNRELVDFVKGGEGLLMAPAYAVPRLLKTQRSPRYKISISTKFTKPSRQQVLCTLKAWESPEFCKNKLGLSGTAWLASIATN